MARRDAVRLDLKVNPSFGNERPRFVESISSDSRDKSKLSSDDKGVSGSSG
jgi:hypothetical protein